MLLLAESLSLLSCSSSGQSCAVDVFVKMITVEQLDPPPTCDLQGRTELDLGRLGLQKGPLEALTRTKMTRSG